jgi:hypothetical protein
VNILKPDRSSESSIGYFPLLKQNPSFRNLWYGQVISELGNWVNSIALYALILQLTGSGMAMAAAMMAKLLLLIDILIDSLPRQNIIN